MVPWYRLVGQVVRAATHREVVSGHWWYEDDSPHLTLGAELQARLVKTVKIQCWVAKLAWTRPSVAALVRVCAIR